MEQKSTLKAQLEALEYAIKITYSGMPLPWVRTQLLKRHEELLLSLNRLPSFESNLAAQVSLEQPLS